MKTVILALVFTAAAFCQCGPNATLKPIGGGKQSCVPKSTLIGTDASGNVAISGTLSGKAANGVFNVRLMYSAVPDGSTDNSAAITNAFTASNAFTSGTPTVYFDCDPGTTACVYNYGGSGTSPINPTVATTILCAPGTTLNYTGTAHAADIGPSNLAQIFTGRYTIQGCRWTGGASYTAGIYVNNWIANTAIRQNEFTNFGNQTAYSIVFNANDWTPTVEGNFWRDTDGTSRNMLDAHTGTNVDLLFTNNKTECETAGGTACSVSTVGVGLWVASGWISNNEIKFHQPLIRISSCSAAGSLGGNGTWMDLNIFEGNTGDLGPAISYGDPSTTGKHVSGPVALTKNQIYWPTASGVPIVGPETASSGSFSLDDVTLVGNFINSTPSGGAVYVNTNGGSSGGPHYVANNKTSGGVPLNQSSSPTLLDSAAASNSARFGLQSYVGNGGALANSIPVFDSNGVDILRGSYHSVAGPLTCADSSGSGTVQSCNTAPKFDISGAAITPTAGDTILYKTTTANTGDVTVNVNGAGAVHVRKYQGSATLAANDLKANVYVPLTYDGTYWELPVLGNAPAGVGTIATTTAPLKGDNAGNAVAATASDLVGLFTSCSGTQYLGADGACHTATGATTVYNTTATASVANITATTMVTPTVDTTYIFSIYVSQTAVTSGCGSQPTATPQISYTSALSGGVLGGLSLRGNVNGGSQFQLTFASSLANATEFTGTQTIRAKANTAVTYQVNYAAGSGCSTGANYAVAVVLMQP